MKTIFIFCPECGSRLEVDAESGEVLSIHRKKREEKVLLEERLKRLEEEKKASEEIFAQQLRGLKEKEKLMEEKFKRALEDSKKREGEEKPIKEIDLD